MKKRSIKYLAFVFIIGICCVHPLAGQEGGFNFHVEDSQREFNPSRDGLPHRSKHTNSHLTQQDGDGNNVERQKTKETVAKSKAAGQKKNETEQHNNNPVVEQRTTEEEKSKSVLSFNFLHYLIQKFKFSDIVNQ